MYFRFVVCFFLIFSSPGMAWNAIGHRVIGELAYQQLKPETKAVVDQLMTAFKKEYPHIDNFGDLAQWPDSLYAQKIKTFAHWHYINNPFTPDDYKITTNNTDTDNALWALKNITPIVKNKRANIYERARFLAFYVHIISDLHQPLHTVSLYSKQFPEGDHGGNLYMVRHEHSVTKLHRLWDGGCGVFMGDYRNFNVANSVKTIASHYPSNTLTQAARNLVFTDWLKEGMQVAKTKVYTVNDHEWLTEQYITDCQQTSERVAALAAYRIATILNHTLN